MPDTKKPPYRLSINLLQPDSEVILFYDTKAAALEDAQKIIKDGYVTQDRREDHTRHLLTFYPLGRVRSIHLYEG